MWKFYRAVRCRLKFSYPLSSFSPHRDALTVPPAVPGAPVSLKFIIQFSTRRRTGAITTFKVQHLKRIRPTLRDLTTRNSSPLGHFLAYICVIATVEWRELQEEHCRLWPPSSLDELRTWNPVAL